MGGGCLRAVRVAVLTGKVDDGPVGPLSESLTLTVLVGLVDGILDNLIYLYDRVIPASLPHHTSLPLRFIVSTVEPFSFGS